MPAAVRSTSFTLAVLLAACAPAERDRGVSPGAPLAARIKVADTRLGRAVFRQCAACHTIDAGTGDRDGPNLHGVTHAQVGRNSARFGYTAALQSVGGEWTCARLDHWLTNPAAFAPGTSMHFPGLRNGLDRADVIAYLYANGGGKPACR
ncbi:c-type cytochrome [Sphingomonas sp. Mn802worker]|uniref:c-type cytochrome n=1 Tax=Sphingomonas sp. Mn802worker TaxID=629773 RepID=UPI0006871BC3|nr:c-type cytochrome [Sphingomonas sp. Mn802worker]